MYQKYRNISYNSTIQKWKQPRTFSTKVTTLRRLKYYEMIQKKAYCMIPMLKIDSKSSVSKCQVIPLDTPVFSFSCIRFVFIYISNIVTNTLYMKIDVLIVTCQHV